MEERESGEGKREGGREGGREEGGRVGRRERGREGEMKEGEKREREREENSQARVLVISCVGLLTNPFGECAAEVLLGGMKVL